MISQPYTYIQHSGPIRKRWRRFVVEVNGREVYFQYQEQAKAYVLENFPDSIPEAKINYGPDHDRIIRKEIKERRREKQQKARLRKDHTDWEGLDKLDEEERRERVEKKYYENKKRRKKHVKKKVEPLRTTEYEDMFTGAEAAQYLGLTYKDFYALVIMYTQPIAIMENGVKRTLYDKKAIEHMKAMVTEAKID